MPWKVKKVGSEYCVLDEAGKSKKCYKTAKEANDYKKALYTNATEQLEELKTIALEADPVIVGIAATNIPHLPLPPMSVVEEGGETKVRVPFLRKGIFRHPNGNLVFDDNLFRKVLENHKAGKSHYGVSLNEKHKPGVAMAWFDAERDGTIVQETDAKYGDLLVAYGKPTSDKVIEMIKNREYAFASVELSPNYKSNMIARLSSDELEEIQLEDLYLEIPEELKMDEVTISLEEYNGLKEQADGVNSLLEQLQAAKDKVAELEQKQVALEVPAKPELPEDVRVMLEEQQNEIARLKKNALETQVALVITKAESYRDSNGNGHSPVLLEIAKEAMLGNEVKVTDEQVIKLESGRPADIADYFRKVFVHMLSTVPGTVRLESKTEPDEVPSFERGLAFKNEDYKAFWAESL